MGWKANNSTRHEYQLQELRRHHGSQEWSFLLLMVEAAWYVAGHNTGVRMLAELVGPVNWVYIALGRKRKKRNRNVSV